MIHVVLKVFQLIQFVSFICERQHQRKGKKRKGKSNGEKVTFVGLKPTPSAIRADVLIQLD